MKDTSAASDAAKTSASASTDAMPGDSDALEGACDALARAADALPGHDAASHREGMRAYFASLIGVLPLLEGPEPSGAFRQQIRTLETARDRLASDAGGSSVEPAIDTGLRTASAALKRIGRDEDFAGQPIQGTLEKLDETVGELDDVRSVGRPYVAADAAKLSAQVVRQMADRLLNGSTAANDAPTSQPAAPAAASQPAPEAPAAAPPAEPAPAPAPAPEAAAPAEEKPADAAPAPAPAPAEEQNK